jgi:hypothetical protein
MASDSHSNRFNRQNPYLSLYGDKWKEEAAKTPAMRKVVNIRDLVRHFIKVGEDTYRGTKWEGKWCFYHDALSLMTGGENMEWMERMGYKKRWILPQHGLLDPFPYYKKNQAPVGNHAGAMPWDQSCNKDHDDIVLRHVAATSQLEEHDPKKFSLRTPKKVSSAYRRIYNNPPVVRDGVPIIPLGEGGPVAYRLGHDIMKTLTYWKQVFDNQGLNVQMNVPGHRGDELRAAAKSSGRSNAGGKRTKKSEMVKSWLHPDAEDAMKEFFGESMVKYETILATTREEQGNMTLPKQPAMDPESVIIERTTLGMGDTEEVESDE